MNGRGPRDRGGGPRGGGGGPRGGGGGPRGGGGGGPRDGGGGGGGPRGGGGGPRGGGGGGPRGGGGGGPRDGAGGGPRGGGGGGPRGGGGGGGPRDFGGTPRGGGGGGGPRDGAGGPTDRPGPPARERFDDRREPPPRERLDRGATPARERFDDRREPPTRERYDRGAPPAHERFDDRREPAREHADAGPVRGPGERVVYGVGPVRELVARRANSIVAVWVDPRRADKSTGDPVAQIVTAARAAGVRVEDRERDILDRAAGEEARHQGIVAWVGALAYVDVDALLEGAARADGSHEPALIVALDGVEDPRNLGAVLRSAYLLGASGVIIPEHRAAQVTAIVSKTSAGASELLPIAQVGNLVRALEELRELGVWRVAVHATEAAQPIERVDLKGPTVLVLGAEGSGVRPLVAKNCDFHALIPMARGGVGSFNVSVAAALALYEARRQRG